MKSPDGVASLLGPIRGRRVEEKFSGSEERTGAFLRGKRPLTRPGGAWIARAHRREAYDSEHEENSLRNDGMPNHEMFAA